MLKKLSIVMIAMSLTCVMGIRNINAQTSSWLPLMPSFTIPTITSTFGAGTAFSTSSVFTSGGGSATASSSGITTGMDGSSYTYGTNAMGSNGSSVSSNLMANQLGTMYTTNAMSLGSGWGIGGYTFNTTSPTGFVSAGQGSTVSSGNASTTLAGYTPGAGNPFGTAWNYGTSSSSGLGSFSQGTGTSIYGMPSSTYGGYNTMNFGGSNGHSGIAYNSTGPLGSFSLNTGTGTTPWSNSFGQGTASVILPSGTTTANSSGQSTGQAGYNSNQFMPTSLFNAFPFI